jgi:hypothetical protein
MRVQPKAKRSTADWVASNFGKISAAVDETFSSYKNELHRSKKTKFIVAIQKELSKELARIGGLEAARFGTGKHLLKKVSIGIKYCKVCALRENRGRNGERALAFNAMSASLVFVRLAAFLTGIRRRS